MTREDIIRMAREADLWLTSDERIAAVERFAKLVAEHERNRTWTQTHWTEYELAIVAQEREACAKLCEEYADDYDGDAAGSGAHNCATAIRARGEQA